MTVLSRETRVRRVRPTYGLAGLGHRVMVMASVIT